MKKDLIQIFQTNKKLFRLTDSPSYNPLFSDEVDLCPICNEPEGKDFYKGKVFVGDEIHYPAVCEICGYREII